MPKLVEPIKYPGIKEVEKNIDFYRDIFIKDSIICFRGSKISFEEQDDLLRVLGENFGWKPSGVYTENHERIPVKCSKEEYLLTWHVEHAYYDNPICGAIWNMHTFKEDPKNGRTSFYPMNKMFYELKAGWRDLALNAYIKVIEDKKSGQNINEYYCKGEWNDGDEYITTRPIAVEHFMTKEPVLRIGNLGNKPDRYKHTHMLDNVAGRAPTQREQEMYFNMHNYVADKINTLIDQTSDSHIVHEWREGDVLIPDLFNMAHSVLGGFDSEKRIFRGVWSTVF